MGWAIETKLPVTTKRDLALIYTPGVGECCLKIKENSKMAMELTNKANSIAILAFENQKMFAVAKSDEYRQKGFDAYPIILKKSKISPQRIAESLHPTFGAFDISLIEKKITQRGKNFHFFRILTTKINSSIPKEPIAFEIPDISTLSDDYKTASLELHALTKGVIKQAWYENEPQLVGVISNGSAVLGFGNIGPDAAMPVMEGKAALFKKFGNVDAIPVCIDAVNLEEFKEIVKALEPTFCGINLEDICAPDCFDVEEELISEMKIPIFHDDQHGTAIVVLAGLINALKLINKTKENVRIVFSGAGAAALAVCKLFLAYGIKNIIMTDINGVIFKGRKENDKYLEEISKKTNLKGLKGSLKDVIEGSDVFVGLSAQGVLSVDMIKSMAQKPVIFALANPNPEIMPDIAKQSGAFIVATGRSDFANQINNSLVFPGIFKGILQSDKKFIDDEIKIRAAIALSNRVDELSQDKIIPDALDMQVPNIIAKAVLGILN